MAESNLCPRCQSELGADAPDGLCPACLLEAGMMEPTNGVLPEGKENPTSGLGNWFGAPQPAELAELFPKLEILELLGEGGMGAVYKARQRDLDRTVALKILPPKFGRDPAFAERFAREARALAQLNHPNIVTVYEFGESSGLFYFIMEYVDGVNLRQSIMSERLTAPEALAIVPQICEALQFAHEEGVVHRDIKPENILLDRRGRVRIADFGLAKLLGTTAPGEKLTYSHQMMGTLHYMAPEQMNNPLAVDHRADIYSLGVVFYELLTGELPLGRFEPPSERAQIDAGLDHVVMRALEREPERRYQHASDVKTDIESIEHPADKPAATRRLPVASARFDPIAVGRSSTSDSVASQSIAAARQAVNQSALALIIIGAINTLIPLIWLIIASITWTWYRRYFGDDMFDAWVFSIIATPVGVLMLMAGLSMRKLKSPTLVAFGAAAGLLPCSPIWLVSAAVSIWALVVLRSAEVKKGFELSQSGGELETDAGTSATLNPRFEPVRGQVQAPATALMVIGALDLLVMLAILVVAPTMVAVLPPPLPVEQAIATVTPASPILAQDVTTTPRIATFALVALVIPMLLNVPLAGVMILGGWKMRQGELHGLAVFASIAAMLPCHAGFLFGLPIGLWSLMVLLRTEVKEAFAPRGPRPVDRGNEASDSLAPPEKQISVQRTSTEELDELEMATARRRVQGPAIGLLVAGVINTLPGLVLVLLGILAFVLRPWSSVEVGMHANSVCPPATLSIATFPTATLPPLASLQSGPSFVPGLWEIAILVFPILIQLPLAIITIVGAWRMKKLQSHGLAMTGSILAMLPCSPGFIVGLPLGIWAMVTLMRNDVKAVFEQQERDAAYSALME